MSAAAAERDAKLPLYIDTEEPSRDHCCQAALATLATLGIVTQDVHTSGTRAALVLRTNAKKAPTRHS